MKKQYCMINHIPAVLFGAPSDKVYLFVHGKCGSKEDAQNFADIACDKGFQVLSFDLPEHGERKDSAEKLAPWEVVPELQGVLSYAQKHWQSVSLYAVSIGTYFSLLSFSNEHFKNCLFLSPILDMVALIEKMMGWASVSAEQLRAKKEIPTDFGETLSWKYYAYAKEHPINTWNSPTAILYAGRDNLTDRGTVTNFADIFGCSLQIHEDGEHWFHTDEQLAVLRNWTMEQLMQNKQNGLQIFCATRADIPEGLTMVNTVAADFPGLDIEDYTKTLQESIDCRTALCARLDGVIAGILLFSSNSRTLLCMAVHPQYRRRGVASALIAEMLRQMPNGDICVTTFRENDPKGAAPRAIYQKFGFVPEALFTEFDYPVQRFVLHRNVEQSGNDETNI